MRTEQPVLEETDVVIVSLERDTEEMEELARSMNYVVRKVFVQRRGAPHPKFFVGKGKVEEITAYLKEGEGGRGVKVAVVNAPLKPTQIFHLQNAWDVTVFDRTRLILEIFSNRARSQEARLQVELAKLEYEVPLVKELIHRTKMGEHPGYMAGGEYQVDQYYEMIRRRIKKIRGRLEAVKQDRAVKRRHRREEGFFLASIAGYTNAGKSMLLKVLTKEETIIEDRFFSTLFTLTRRGKGRIGGSFLFSDTVGFIKDLPPWLLDAFHSTLEEIFLADLVLLVIDASEGVGTMVEKIMTSYQFLRYQDEVPSVVLVFNKMDLAEDLVQLKGEVEGVLSMLNENQVPFVNHCLISAKEGIGIETLIQGMTDSLENLEYVIKVKINLDEEGNEGIINWIHNNYIVIETSESGRGQISVVILCKRNDYSKIVKRMDGIGTMSLK